MDAYQPQQPEPEPFYKRHGLAFAIATGVLALVVLLGVTAVGAFAVTFVAVQASHSHVLRSDGMRQGPAPAPHQLERGVIRGTIASVSGNTWRVESMRGGTVTVKITSATVFGAPGTSRSASDYSPGDEVAIEGSRSGDTITARRVVEIPDGPQRPPMRPGSPATPGDRG